MLHTRWIVGPFARLAAVGLAWTPTTRTCDNLGGQGGEGTGGSPEVTGDAGVTGSLDGTG
jgi:hypothetical protein